jgi:hypothetical protein
MDMLQHTLTLVRNSGFRPVSQEELVKTLVESYGYNQLHVASLILQCMSDGLIVPNPINGRLSITERGEKLIKPDPNDTLRQLIVEDVQPSSPKSSLRKTIEMSVWVITAIGTIIGIYFIISLS